MNDLFEQFYEQPIWPKHQFEQKYQQSIWTKISKLNKKTNINNQFEQKNQ